MTTLALKRHSGDRLGQAAGALAAAVMIGSGAAAAAFFVVLGLARIAEFLR